MNVSWNLIRLLNFIDVNFVQKASQPCTNLLSACRFSGKDVSCDHIFRSILTDEGLCCTFNSLDASFMFRKNSENNNFDITGEKTRPSIFWSPETAFHGKEFEKTPRPNVGAGVHMGLSIMLNVDLQEYFCSSSNSYGFKVLLHNPVETPKISNFGMLLSPGQECELNDEKWIEIIPKTCFIPARLQFSPIWYSASVSIKDITKGIRQCLFENESSLEFFRYLTLFS